MGIYGFCAITVINCLFRHFVFLQGMWQTTQVTLPRSAVSLHLTLTLAADPTVANIAIDDLILYSLVKQRVTVRDPDREKTGTAQPGDQDGNETSGGRTTPQINRQDSASSDLGNSLNNARKTKGL